MGVGRRPQIVVPGPVRQSGSALEPSSTIPGFGALSLSFPLGFVARLMLWKTQVVLKQVCAAESPSAH